MTTRFILTLAFMTWMSSARADVPPGPPPGTDDCTVDKQCKDGATCPTLGGEVDKDCAAGMTQKGFVQKCMQPRPTGGKAVYCPGAPAKKGCGKSSMAPASGGEGSVPLALGLTCLAAVALRRARSRRSPTR